MLLTLVILAAFAGVLLIARLLQVVTEHTLPMEKAGRKEKLHICVVLGSGGHTSEMIATLRLLPVPFWKQCSVTYIVSATDKDSALVAKRFEDEVLQRPARVHVIPRAREVGQSYVTSIGSTLTACLTSIAFMRKENIDVILTNGPGVCVPVIFSSLLVAAITFSTRPAVAYFESFTCVDHLSLSGRLMLPVADVFTVQWKILDDILKRQGRKFAVRSLGGRLWFTGPVKSQASGRIAASKVTDVAVVTVGSTQFDELVQQVDSTAFFKSLYSLGIRRCLIQKGRSNYKLKTVADDEGSSVVAGIEVDVFRYKPFLQRDIQQAKLVISHAGAGTILEALAHQTPLVVVPNERLMSNHQLQLAQSLADDQHLFLVRVENFATAIPSLRLDDLVAFPPPNLAANMEVFRRLFRRDIA